MDWDGFRLVLDRIGGLEPDVDLRAVFEVHPLPGGHRVGPFELTDRGRSLGPGGRARAV